MARGRSGEYYEGKHQKGRSDMRICKLAALLAAAALSVGMLTACSKSDASSMMPSPTPMSQATDEAADTPETAPATATPEDADMGYTEAGLTRVLGGFVTYEAGSAGGSLKAAIAAADVVRYTAQYGKGHEEEIRTDAMNWKNSLDADQQALLEENWPDICYTAKSITEDPEKTKGMLADAGVTEDFSGVDLETAASCVDVLDEVLGKAE